jgi:hypothetical protein
MNINGLESWRDFNVTLTLFSEIVGAFCKYPRMYTRYGTLAEVVTYLDGYAWGARVPRGITPFSFFLSDLAKKLNHSDSFTPWEFLMNIYGTEEKVLAALPDLYYEHAKENSANND